MIGIREGKMPTREPINDHMMRGLLTEPLHFELLKNTQNGTFLNHDQNVFVYNNHFEWAHYLPDGWAVTADHGKIPLQMKCPTSMKWHQYKLEGIPTHYLISAQHAMAVTDSPAEYWSFLNSESMRTHTVIIERDNDAIKKIMETEKQFFELVENGTPPAIAVETTDFNSLESPGELFVVDAVDPITQKDIDAYIESKELLKQAKAINDRAKTKLIEIMGENNAVQLPGLRCYYREQQGRVFYDYKAMKQAGIDLTPFKKQGKSFKSFKAYGVDRR